MKNNTKKCPKKGTQVSRLILSWGGGALNNQAFAQPCSKTEHAPGVPKGTVADFGWDQEDEGLFFRDFHDSRVISLFARRYLLKGIVLSGVVSGNG